MAEVYNLSEMEYMELWKREKDEYERKQDQQRLEDWRNEVAKQKKEQAAVRGQGQYEPFRSIQ